MIQIHVNLHLFLLLFPLISIQKYEGQAIIIKQWAARVSKFYYKISTFAAVKCDLPLTNSDLAFVKHTESILSIIHQGTRKSSSCSVRCARAHLLPLGSQELNVEQLAQTDMVPETQTEELDETTGGEQYETAEQFDDNCKGNFSEKNNPPMDYNSKVSFLWFIYAFSCWCFWAWFVGSSRCYVFN